MRPSPTHVTSPLPQSCSPSTLIRLFTRSRMDVASSDWSLAVVNEAHSGFCPTVSVLRYEIRYLGMWPIILPLNLDGPWPSTVASLHELTEAMEEVVRIVRAGRCFGVVLHREHRQLAVPQSLARVVVEVHVARLPAVRGDRLRVDGEAVILRRDLYLPGREI